MRKPKTKPAAETTPAPAPAGKTAKPANKLDTLITLLKRPEGATVNALSEATGWQAHSVRGAMSGALKKQRGLTISSEKTEAGRIYRIVEGAGA